MSAARPHAARWLRAALAGLVACWLLTQALGQIHGVLHARPAARAAAAASDALSRAFHPQGDPARGDDGVCRLYAQVAQGDLASGAAPMAAAFALACTVPAHGPVPSADTAPRHAVQARGPPAFG